MPKLLGLCWWRTHQLGAAMLAPPGRWAACRDRVLATYRHDLDLLLDLRSWLCEREPAGGAVSAARPNRRR